MDPEEETKDDLTPGGEEDQDSNENLEKSDEEAL